MRKKESKDQRELKVYTKYAFSKYGKASILPEIRLKGNWVRENGFECGDSLLVFKIGDQLIIKNLNIPLHKIYL